MRDTANDNKALVAAMFIRDQPVPWVRSFEEYRSKVALSDADLQLRILGRGSGTESHQLLVFPGRAVALLLEYHNNSNSLQEKLWASTVDD